MYVIYTKIVRGIIQPGQWQYFEVRAHLSKLEIYIYCLYKALVRPMFLSSIFLTILVSASSSYFALAFTMREVSCAGYTLRTWNLRSL